MTSALWLVPLLVACALLLGYGWALLEALVGSWVGWVLLVVVAAVALGIAPPTDLR